MKFAKFLSAICCVAAVVGCEPVDNPQEKPIPTPDVDGLWLAVDSTVAELGDEIKFAAFFDGEDISTNPDLHIYDNTMQEVVNLTYAANETGSFSFFATYGADSSNRVYLTVMATLPEIPADPQPESLAFNHRVVVIDHTGVNCGYCPMMTDNLLALAETEWHQYYNEVTCHAGSMAAGDPGNSPAANVLNEMQRPNGYPNIALNFRAGTVGNYQTSAFLGYMGQALNRIVKKNGADVGISVAVEGDEDVVYCTAQVKAAVEAEYHVVAWLLESNIYSPNQAGASKDVHRIYNYALRNISGEYSKADVSGESIGVLRVGETHDCGFELEVTKSNWKVENMSVLVIVSAKNSSGSFEVVNSALCNVGATKEIEYL